MTHSGSRLVHFAHAFSLEGVEGTFPPGTYAIEETTEPVEGLTFIGYRRTKTTIELPWSSASSFSRQLVEIEPADLQAALARDATASEQLERSAENQSVDSEGQRSRSGPGAIRHWQGQPRWLARASKRSPA